MKLGKLRINKPKGSMGCFAAWQRENGYWRWALYFETKIKGWKIYRSRSATGSIFPHFGGGVTTPFGTIRLATQPPWRTKGR